MEKPFSAYQGNEPYTFVCYAHDDADLVYPEIGWLRDQGVNIWYDEGISGGSNWRSVIGEALIEAEQVLCFISSSSLVSDHCNREINLALDEGKSVVPVYLEEVELTPDLKVGLNRLHALHYVRGDQSYRSSCLRALSRRGTPGRNVVKTQSRSNIQRWLLVAVTLISVTSIGLAWRWLYFDEPQEDVIEAQAIVVLPFDSLSIDPEDAFLADGLAEELRTALRTVVSLKIAPTTSSMYYRDHPAPLAEIGEALGVQYAIEGSVRRSGELLRVSARLLRTDRTEEVDAITLDRSGGELLALQSELALAILDALAPEMLEGEALEASEVGTNNEQAFNLYLKALDLVDQDTLESHQRARKLLVATISLDPYFYRAHKQLMLATIGIGFRSFEFELARERLLHIRERLEHIDPEKTRATLRTEDGILAAMRRDWSSQEQILRNRLIDHPNDPDRLRPYGRLLANAGLFAAARAYYERALQRDPFDPALHESIGDMSLALGEYDRAVSAFQRCDELRPGRTGCPDMLVRALALGGDTSTAMKNPAWERSAMKECFLLGELAACTGEDEWAERIPHYAGYVAARRGDMETAYAWFGVAADADNGWSFIDQIRWQHQSVGLNLKGPRYQALLERLNLSDSWRDELCGRTRLLTPHTGVETICRASPAP